MRAKTVFSLVALSAGVLFAAEAPDALAKGKGRGRKNKSETVRLATPAQGASTGAKGTITISTLKGGSQDAVLRLRGLDRRTTYEVVDGVTGETLGTVTSNKKGRATFDLTPGVGGRKARADSADGSDGTEVPEIVDVVDPETGDTVLTGDTTGTLQGLYGYASLGNATESVSITMGSDPWAEMEYFSFSYFAPMDEENWIAPVYEMWVDTSTGELPLGVSSVLDLAGKDFQVRDANGDVVFRGSLPDVEAYEIEALPELPEDPGMGIWEGEPYPVDDPMNGWLPDGSKPQDFGGMPFDFGTFTDMGNGFDTFLMGGFFMGGMWGKTGRNDPSTDPVEDPVVDPPADPVYTLWLETADGFAKAGNLEAPVWEFPDDDWGGGGCWDDSGDWTDDWTDDWSDDWDLGWEDDWSDTWNWDTGEWTWDTGDWTWADDPAATGNAGGKRNGRRNRR